MKSRIIFNVAILSIFIGVFGHTSPIELAKEVTLQYEDAKLYQELLLAIKDSNVSPYILEEQLKKIIGDIINNIEDPLKRDQVDIDVDAVDSNIRLTGNAKNVTVVGVHKYEIVSISFNGISTFQLTLRFAGINANGYYDIDGSIGKLIPIFGKGAFNLTVENAEFGIEVHVGAFNGSLIVKELNLDLGLETFWVFIENFLGGLGDVIQDILNDNLADYLARFMYWHGPALENAIGTKINETLDGKTIGDLIDWIKNYTSQTTTAAPFTGFKPIKLY